MLQKLWLHCLWPKKNNAFFKYLTIYHHHLGWEKDFLCTSFLRKHRLFPTNKAVLSRAQIYPSIFFLPKQLVSCFVTHNSQTKFEAQTWIHPQDEMYRSYKKTKLIASDTLLNHLAFCKPPLCIKKHIC